ncbi:hypothetical protein [Clostridium perfringens]|uniref:hypothetical protein n=1 Tax=Clostridium perfringens TaxID=1502 RepID=UPI0009933E8B|nr:hypothetical protein [Clostridium perfringens]AQW22833.1 hypothetical protein BXT91_02580 [Clostridium perfringens]MBI6105658.1 hypothetical protein [Clostridium perfringens]MBO3322739.1 hypothetical protein [Clostridium perfringens]MBO3331852.1 hypothetical protein [Clostridium perfringens]MBO3411013.1 hypothetical protein [Clostridium perfringens]
MNVHIVRCDNNEVTDFYLDMIDNALKKANTKKGEEYSSDNILKIEQAFEHDKTDFYIVATSLVALKLLIRGYRNIILWFQGINPEESYMRNGSRMRYYILSIIEKYVLKRVSFIILVSNEMISHYEKKYKLHISEKNSMVIPCFNDKLDIESFDKTEKYTNNRFCYVGSTAKWQKFDTIISLYKEFEKSLENCNLLVLTGDVEGAKKIINEKGIKNYCIKHVKPEEVAHEISNCKFGFIIRDNCAVNRVSTPTKISNYLASGVIPVFSSCICDFAELSKEMKYAVRVMDYNNSEEVLALLGNLHTVNVAEIKKEYQEVFSKYYNDAIYIDKLALKFQERLF